MGGLYAMFAAGLSLIFGIMRLVNIAHGDLIVLAAYLALVATETLGIGPLAALLIVAPGMALIGYALQRLVLNRTLGDDLLPPLLVTFGLSVIIQNGLLELFSADSRKLQAGAIETASFPLMGGISIGLLPLLSFAVAVAVIAALQFVLYRTALGRAFRATSDDPSVAQLMGLDNRHIFALAMALSLAVVAVAGVLLAVRANFDPAIGPARLIFGFESVIIGGLGSLWGTLVGGILLGVAQAIGAQIDPGWQTLAGHLTFLAGAGGAAGRAVPEGARMTVRVEYADRSGRAGLWLMAIALAVLAAAPAWGGRDDLRLLTEIYAYVGLASLWNLLAGYAGLVSVGQQAYVGLGAYLLFALTLRAGLPPLWAIPLAGVISTIVAHPDRRAAVPAARALFRDRHLDRGRGVSAARLAGLGAGRRLRPEPAGRDRDLDCFQPAGARVPDLLGGARAGDPGAPLIVWLLRSRYGLALKAIRDNELAARSNGVDVTRIKVLVYIITAFATAMIGALIFLQKLRISPDAAFSVNDWTAFVIFMTVIGGIGRIEGPIVGAVVFFLLRQTLADLGTLYLLLLGAVAIAVMLFAPKGIWGLIVERFGWQLFPLERRVILDEGAAAATAGRK